MSVSSTRASSGHNTVSRGDASVGSTSAKRAKGVKAETLVNAMPSADKERDARRTLGADAPAPAPSGAAEAPTVPAYKVVTNAGRNEPDPARAGKVPELATPDVKVGVAFINDSHSDFRNAARAIRLLKCAREADPNALLLHAGDAFVGTPLFKFGGQGVAEMQILREANLDGYVIGNHDLDNGTAALAKALAEVPDVNVIVANWAITGPLAERVKPYFIKEIDGKKVAVIGLSIKPEEFGFTEGTITYEAPAKTLARLIPEIQAKEKPDAIVVASHIGENADDELSGYFPGVNAWFGGHDHHSTYYADRISHPDGSTSISVEAGCDDEKVGIVTLAVKDHKLLAYTSKLEPVSEIVDEDPAVVKILSAFKPQFKELEKVIAEAKSVVSARSTTGVDTHMGNWVTDIMRAELGGKGKKADIAIFNKTGLRASLPKGPVTLESMYELFPFDNSSCTVTLTGAQVQAMLDNSAKRGGDAVSGVTYGIKNGKATNIKVGNAKLDPKKSYLIAANSYMVLKGGSGYSIFLEGKDPKDTGIDIRDLLIKHCEALPADEDGKKFLDVTPKIEQRTERAEIDPRDDIRERLGLALKSSSRASWDWASAASAPAPA